MATDSIPTTAMGSSTTRPGAPTSPGPMPSEPKPTVPLMLTKLDLEAAKVFVLEFDETDWSDYEVDKWFCIREIISLIFVWLGYIPHPILPATADGDKLDKGMDIVLEVYFNENPEHLCNLQPDITKSAFLENISDQSMTADLHAYVRAPIPPLKWPLVQPHVPVHPQASIPHLLRLLQFPFRDAHYSIYHETTVGDTVEVLRFLEGLPLRDLCARGIWGRDHCIADQSRTAFCSIVRAWLGLLPAQDIPDSESYELLSDRVSWLKGQAKHSSFLQKANIWTRDQIEEKADGIHRLHAATADERLRVVDGKVTAVDERLRVIDGKVTAVGERLRVIDGKVTAVDERLRVIVGKVTAVDERLTTVDQTHKYPEYPPGFRGYSCRIPEFRQLNDIFCHLPSCISNILLL